MNRQTETVKFDNWSPLPSERLGGWGTHDSLAELQETIANEILRSVACGHYHAIPELQITRADLDEDLLSLYPVDWNFFDVV